MMPRPPFIHLLIRLLLLLLLTAAPLEASAAQPPCGQLLLFQLGTLTSEELLDVITETYGSFFEGELAGRVDLADLELLRNGDPFLFPQDARSERDGIREGLADLGDVVKSAGEPPGLKARLRTVLGGLIAARNEADREAQQDREEVRDFPRELRRFGELNLPGLKFAREVIRPSVALDSEGRAILWWPSENSFPKGRLEVRLTRLDGSAKDRVLAVPVGEYEQIESWAVTPDGTEALISTGRGGAVYRFDLATGAPLPTVRLPGREPLSSINQIRVSPDGRYVVLALDQAQVYLWDRHSPDPPRILDQSEPERYRSSSPARAVAFSRDSRFLALGLDSRDGLVFDLDSDSMQAQVRGNFQLINHRSVGVNSGKGQAWVSSLVETSRGWGAKLWSLLDGSHLRDVQVGAGKVAGHAMPKLSEDGRFAAYIPESRKSRVNVTALESGVTYYAVTPNELRSIELTPDGRFLLAFDRLGHLWIYDLNQIDTSKSFD